jgi:AcrR family transcriptional regulator
MATPETGLRERKKQRTRAAIADAALKLFDERGFEHTTVADIAAAADVAPRTFFTYFPSKEHVLFAEFDDTLASLRERLQNREPGETAVDALRAWVAAMEERTNFDDERERCRQQVIAGSEALLAHRRTLMGRAEAVLSEAVAVDLGTDAEDVRPRMIAAAAVAAMSKLGEYYKADEARRSTGESRLEVVDHAFTFLRGGIAAMRNASR